MEWVSTFTESDSAISILCEEHADRSEAGLRSADDDQVILLAGRVTVHHAGRRQRQHRHRRHWKKSFLVQVLKHLVSTKLEVFEKNCFYSYCKIKNITYERHQNQWKKNSEISGIKIKDNKVMANNWQVRI